MDNDEFDKKLDALRNLQPNELQLQKWKSAVRKNLGDNQKLPYRNTPHRPRWGQLAAAMVAGILIGALLFGQRDSENKNLEFAYEDATIEVVYTKL